MNDAFEKQLRDAWAKQAFPVDPDHRAAMEQLLQTRDRRRPLIFWWIGGLLLLGAGAACVIWFALQDAAGDTASGSVGQARGERPPAVSDNPATADSTTLSTVPPAAPVTRPSTQSGASITEIPVREEVTRAVQADHLGVPKRRSSSATSGAPSTTNKAGLKKQPGIAAGGDATGESARMPGSGLQPTPMDKEDARPQLAAIDHPDARPADPASLTQDANEPDAAEVTLHSHIAVAPIPSLDAREIATASPAVLVEPALTSHRRWYLFAETAGTYIPADKPQSPQGWQLQAGAGAGFGLAPRLEGLVSAGYMVQDGGFSFSKSSTVRQLGFGVRSAFNSLSPDRLHHLYVKAGVQYRLRRHILSARAGVCYLYGAQGDITVVQADQLASGTVEQTTRRWLNMDGLRRVFGVADLGYGYQLTPALSAVAGVTWRPSPVVNADDALEDEGYALQGNMPAWQGFLSLQFRFYGKH